MIRRGDFWVVIGLLCDIMNINKTSMEEMKWERMIDLRKYTLKERYL